MASFERFFDPDVLARLGGIEVRARSVVEGVISGLHRSPFSGTAVEFADHREYVPGDDPRHIDWKVYGRANRFVIKRFEEETNLRAHILLDCSESMRFIHAGSMSKYEYGATLAASVAYLLQRQKDAVGLAIFDSEVRERVPPSSHPGWLTRIAEAMDRARPDRKTGIGKLLARIAEEVPLRGMVIIVSDLFAPVEEFDAGLRELAARRHEVAVFHVLDEAELTFPFEGNTLFHGLEDMGELLAEPRALRDSYLQAMARFLEGIEGACARSGADYQRLHTGEPLDAAVISIAQARARSARRSR